MSTVPQWLLGREVTAIAIIPQTVGAGGVLTPGTSAPLTGLLDEIAPDEYNDTENIVPMDVRQDNEVIIGSGIRLMLREILSPNTGASFNVLAQAGALYDYVSVTFTRSGLTPFTSFFVIKGYTESIVRGKSMGTLTLGPAGISGGGY